MPYAPRHALYRFPNITCTHHLKETAIILHKYIIEEFVIGDIPSLSKLRIIDEIVKHLIPFIFMVLDVWIFSDNTEGSCDKASLEGINSGGEVVTRFGRIIEIFISCKTPPSRCTCVCFDHLVKEWYSYPLSTDN